MNEKFKTLFQNLHEHGYAAGLVYPIKGGARLTISHGRYSREVRFPDRAAATFEACVQAYETLAREIAEEVQCSLHSFA